MTIQKTVDYVLNQPFTKQALDRYHKGDDKDLRHLLSELQIHSWQIVSANACRVYGQNKRRKSNEIMQEIKEMPPPENLSILLPFVATIKECIVVPLVAKVKLAKGYKVPNQLEIDFKKEKPPVMAAFL